MPILLWVILIRAYRLGKDWIRWRKWTQSHRTSMTTKEFFETISQFLTGTFSIWLVRTTREQGLLVAMEDTEILVQRLALALEQTQSLPLEPASSELLKRLTLKAKYVIKRRRAHSKNKDHLSQQVGSKPSESGIFELWLAEYTKKDKRRLAKLGSPFLDEVCKVLELIRARRLG